MIDLLKTKHFDGNVKLFRFKRVYDKSGLKGWVRTRDLICFYAQRGTVKGEGWHVYGKDAQGSTHRLSEGRYHNRGEALARANKLVHGAAERARLTFYIGLASALAGIIGTAWAVLS